MKSHLYFFLTALTSTTLACEDVSLHKNAEACETGVWYLDSDGDGFGGNEAEAEASCDPLEGYVQNNSDCDDNNPSINPAGTEICNGFDDDCDFVIDNGLFDSQAWYLDSDGDGFGNDDSLIYSCDVIDGYIGQGGDCDDGDINIHPNANEICDGIDNNCDKNVDDGLEKEFFVDSDTDGYGNSEISIFACEAPQGYVDNDLDCDDSNENLTLDCEPPKPVIPQTRCNGGMIYSATGPSNSIPELHILSAYEPTNAGVINVQVDRVAQMTLVLSSYEAVHWIVNHVSGVQIDRILLNGYHSQTITADPSIPVETRSYDQNRSDFGASCGYSYPYTGGGCNTEQLLQGVTAYTGLDWTSFNGCYFVDEFLLE